MKSKSALLILFMSLLACTFLNKPEPLTAHAVIRQFTDAGLEINDVQPRERDPDSPLPNSYEKCLTFSTPEVAPKGGQVFTCATKKNCDALYVYFDALKSLAGPYLYQSPNGLVVVQLNKGLSPKTAAQFEDVVKKLP